MNALHLSHIRSLVPPKIIWMRVNRILAWALIGSPVVQFELGTPFYKGLVIDLLILLAHAVFSLVLFGLPKLKTREFSVAMYVFGLLPDGITERNQFLLSGYRIALAVLLNLLTGLAGVLMIRPLLIPLFLASLWPTVRLPVSLVQHIHAAVVYAFKRWGMPNGAADMATMTVVFYMLLSLINLFK